MFYTGPLEGVRSDADKAFTSKEFHEMCVERKLKLSFASPRHQEMNGLAERSWRSVRDLAFSMMVHAQVGDELYDFAHNHAWKVFNCLPISGLQKECKSTTPFELFFGQAPSLRRSKVLFCSAIMAIGEKTFEGRTLDRRNNPERGIRGIHVGIANRSEGWLIYAPSTNKTYVSNDVSFDEKFAGTLVILENRKRMQGGIALQPHPQDVIDDDQAEVVGFNPPSDQGGESDAENLQNL